MINLWSFRMMLNVKLQPCCSVPPQQSMHGMGMGMGTLNAGFGPSPSTRMLRVCVGCRGRGHRHLGRGGPGRQ